MRVRLEVSGSEYHPRSTLVRPYDEEIEIDAESLPDALIKWLAHGDLDSLDLNRPFSVHVAFVSAES